jgi:hypothetical protein
MLKEKQLSEEDRPLREVPSKRKLESGQAQVERDV